MQLAMMAALDQVEDPDLLLHLIASHHGRCRPLAPVIDDPDPVQVSFHFNGINVQASSRTGFERIDSGVAKRFWRLIRRYG
jgi:CRISPR-associated endonuclease/helicase Cas3